MGVVVPKMKHYMSIRPGETKAIKKSATILSVINYGAVNYTSTCGDLPPADVALCYTLSWAVTDDHNSSAGAWDNHNAIQRIDSFTVMGSQYPLAVNIYEPQNVVTLIQAALGNTSLITDIVYFSTGGNMLSNGFTFKTIPSIAESFYLSVTGGVAGVSSMRIYGVEMDCPGSGN